MSLYRQYIYIYNMYAFLHLARTSGNGLLIDGRWTVYDVKIKNATKRTQVGWLFSPGCFPVSIPGGVDPTIGLA